MSQAREDTRLIARILVVEDHDDTAKSLAKFLEIFGYQVRIACDGPRAIAAATGWRPDCILLDLGLPGMDGFEVASRLRRVHAGRRLAVIAITGHGLPDARQRSIAAGIDRHLLKPVDLGELLVTISRLAQSPPPGEDPPEGPTPGPPSLGRGAPVGRVAIR